MCFKVLQNMSSLQVINWIYWALWFERPLYTRSNVNIQPVKRGLGFPTPSRAHAHYINTVEPNSFFYHENMFLLLCTTNRKRMSHVHG